MNAIDRELVRTALAAGAVAEVLKRYQGGPFAPDLEASSADFYVRVRKVLILWSARCSLPLQTVDHLYLTALRIADELEIDPGIGVDPNKLTDLVEAVSLQLSVTVPKIRFE